MLKVDSSNTKALYRRALANKGQADNAMYNDPKDIESLRIKEGLYSLARTDLERLNLLEQDNKAVK